MQELDATKAELGDALDRAGRSDEALEAYREGQVALEQALRKDPTDQRISEQLCERLKQLGALLETRGKLEEALTVHHSTVQLLGKVSARDPSNEGSQRELAAGYSRVGTVLEMQGRLEEALASYRSGMAIADRFHRKELTNPSWRGEVALIYNRIGGVLELQGNLEEALVAQQTYKAMIEEMISQDESGNPFWQRELAVSHDRIGSVMEARQIFDHALISYRACQAIMERLVASEESNAGWRRRLALTHKRLARVLRKQGKPIEATQEIAAANVFLNDSELAKAGKILWRRDLLDLLRLEADVHLRTNDAEAAFRSVEEARRSYGRIRIEPGSEAFWLPEHARILSVRGEALRALGKEAEAEANFSEAATILDPLVKASPTHAEWRQDLERVNSLRGRTSPSSSVISSPKRTAASRSERRRHSWNRRNHVAPNTPAGRRIAANSYGAGVRAGGSGRRSAR